MTFSTPRTIPKTCDLTENFIMHKKQMPRLIWTKQKSPSDTSGSTSWHPSFWVHKKEIKKHFFYEQISSKFFVFILFSGKN